MNAKPNIPDYQHQANRELTRSLTEQGYRFEVSSQGYQVTFKGVYIHGAGNLQKCHGRYREANIRDNLETAVRVAQVHAAEKKAAAQEPEITRVLFRKYKNKQGEVLALFPELPGRSDGFTCSCYVHQGQHGIADPQAVMSQTRRATPDEYASLKRELESAPFNYRFKVALKGNAQDFQKRKEACKR